MQNCARVLQRPLRLLFLVSSEETMDSPTDTATVKLWEQVTLYTLTFQMNLQELCEYNQVFYLLSVFYGFFHVINAVVPCISPLGLERRPV